MAGKTTEVFLRGKAHFFKLLGRGDVKYESWSTGLYLDDEAYNTFLSLKKGNETTDGIMNDIKITEDGNLIQLRRRWTKEYQGKVTALTPPVVLDKNNMPWPTDKSVGNGSDIIIKCEHYTFKPPFKNKRGSALRLVSCRIEDLVPFERLRDFTEDQAKQVKGLTDKPVQYF